MKPAEEMRTLRHSKGDIPTKTMMRYLLVNYDTEEVLAQSDHIDLITAMTQTSVAQSYMKELGAMTYVLDLDREAEPIRAYVKYNAAIKYREEKTENLQYDQEESLEHNINRLAEILAQEPSLAKEMFTYLVLPEDFTSAPYIFRYVYFRNLLESYYTINNFEYEEEEK